MNRILFGATIAWTVLAGGGVIAEQVVINEVMYNPRGDAPEWIELSNITATPFDIAGWKLRGDIELDFPSFDGNSGRRIPRSLAKGHPDRYRAGAISTTVWHPDEREGVWAVGGQFAQRGRPHHGKG